MKLENTGTRRIASASIVADIQDLGKVVATAQKSISITADESEELQISLKPPPENYRGYRVEVRVMDGQGKVLAQGATAIDVSSDWKRFPRYGYLAHYEENIPSSEWIEELNRFHINGLQFYDFQYKHHQPAPPPDLAKTGWHDIANRSVSAKTLSGFLSAAKAHNMTTMAYNASYAAYDDAFQDGSGVKLEWAAWPDANGPRTEATAKALPMPPNWATKRLVYMNQDDPGWRKYIFSQMNQLFKVFPFDGWHIDSFGDHGAFAWDRSPINYFAGFAKFADAAQASLKRPIVLNTVDADGQIEMSNSSVEFVYSELWPGKHSTYASIEAAADEVHAANPKKAVVFPAYLHKELSDTLKESGSGQANFDPPAVLLADAVMFSVGAAHLELGDGTRMLSNPYFPADTAITPSEELRSQLKNYYDFLVAYENYLRDEVRAASFPIVLSGPRQTRNGEAGAVWMIGREKDQTSMVHLINFTGLKDTNWRDDGLDYSPPPVLHNVGVTVQLSGEAAEVGWASPDIDDGRWHPLPLQRKPGQAFTYEVTVPELRYWTMLIFRGTKGNSVDTSTEN